MLLDGPSGIVDARFPQIDDIWFWRFIKTMPFENDPMFFLDCFKSLGASKDKHRWFWEPGTCPKIPENEK